VATARTPAQLDDLAERYADRVLVVALDVTDAAASAFEAAAGRFGRVDVVAWAPTRQRSSPSMT
jgi:NADP-dependent 3-hydroxy acid dehydrogenase YdfG